MTRTLLIGLLLFLGFAVVLAPASLLRNLLPDGADVELLSLRGTLWSGAGELYLGGRALGRIEFDFAPSTLLGGRIGYEIALSGAEHALDGTVGLGFDAAEAALNGRAGSALINRWLADYDIALSGELGFRDVRLQVPWDVRTTGAGRAAGTVTWTGGPVRYVLSGRPFGGDLPPVVGYLGDGLEAVVLPEGGQTPLLTAELLPAGFVRIGVTKLLTRLAGNPWPGSHADHETVLSVEQQLF